MDSKQAEKFMAEAIIEGRKANTICSPNPPVGCVLIRSGKIIARGHTNAPSQPHAEAMALNQLEGTLDDVIAFVTLEPCSFHGRTPSCAMELIKRNIGSVYIGMIDPDPRNNGQSIEMLEAAGIQVKVGILSDVIQNELEPYLIKEH